MVGSHFQVLGPVLIGSLLVLSASASAGSRSQFSWTGFYAGANAGYAMGDADFGINPNGKYISNAPGEIPIIKAATNATLEPDGFIGGGQIGYNEQVGNWLWGLEADFDGVDADESRTGGPIVGTGTQTFTQRAEMSWLATARARLGFTMDRTLVYATGGVAFADWDVSMYLAGGGTEAFFRDSSVRTGWTVGGGWEYALDRHWSLKGEYLYADFGHANGSSEYSNGGNGYTQDHEVELTAQVARGGINYKY